jgi:hypothetical protein
VDIAPATRQNQLLLALGDARGAWSPHLKPVDLTLGQVLYESGNATSDVYFPTTAIVAKREYDRLLPQLLASSA